MSLRLIVPDWLSARSQGTWQRPSLRLHGVGWVVGLSVVGSSGALAQEAIDQLPAVPPDLAVQAAPASVEPPAAIAPSEVSPSLNAGGDADAFVDRTDYSLGATQRYEVPELSAGRNSEATVAQPGISAPEANAPQWSSRDAVSVAPVQVGGVSLSAGGISWNAGSTPQVEPPATGVGQAYSTVKAYYNRTARPIGQVGNGDIKLLFPLSLPVSITSLFGWRIHPITGNPRFHAGTDLGAPLGAPVLAALTGRVIMADFFGGYGLAIALEHGQGSQQTLYAHLSEIFVKPGEVIKQGAAIGRVGSTGASTGPHLHFEFRQETTEGWVAMDAGFALETALADLTKSLQVAQVPEAQ
ncbi:M23 family metallopeptidase [Myxacorys almedinensis]|uniref:Peptidoglycan DD-metalloendopeptidase family protein n=1 Tax=Myxacorys almedinensis A TaxID=2690445 RepID=A0A8J8CKG7_9CYAN|nr:M23 family metallopeptidase [Myxacorys almedinensis]NDJ19519.1 peptidoglycan DD-metalloendopeptidase family protein [Myxacorys almedinensis A]